MPVEPSELIIHTEGPSDAPVLVLLHGFMDDHTVWAEAVARWSGYRIVAPDARGHGSSPRLAPEEATPTAAPALIRDTVATVDSLSAQGFSCIALVGHSMGAGMAAAAAAQRPDLVSALVLEDPAWLTAERVRGWRDAHVAQEWAQEWRADEAAALAAAAEEHPSWPVEWLRPWGAAKTRIDPQLKHTGQIVDRAPWPELAASLRCPTLVLTGDRPDNTIDDASIEIIRESGNEALEVVRVQQAGHYVRRDNPGGYHQVVDPFLAQHLVR